MNAADNNVDVGVGTDVDLRDGRDRSGGGVAYNTPHYFLKRARRALQSEDPYEKEQAPMWFEKAIKAWHDTWLRATVRQRSSSYSGQFQPSSEEIAFLANAARLLGEYSAVRNLAERTQAPELIEQCLILAQMCLRGWAIAARTAEDHLAALSSDSEHHIKSLLQPLDGL